MAVPAVKQNKFGALIEWLDKRAPNIEKRLGTGPDAENWMAVVRTTLRDNSRLWDCDLASLEVALYRACELRLSLDSVLSEAHLIPYRGKNGRTTAELQLGYRGLRKLVLQGGAITVDTRSVRQGDKLVIRGGGKSRIIHELSPAADRHLRPITHVYATALITRSVEKFEVMTTGEVEAHKERFVKDHKSPTSPWNTSWEAMALKTVLRRLCTRQCQLSTEASAIVARMESMEAETMPQDAMTAEDFVGKFAGSRALETITDAQAGEAYNDSQSDSTGQTGQ